MTKNISGVIMFSVAKCTYFDFMLTFRRENMAFWIVFLLVAAVLYFAAMMWLLPKAFLKSKYSFNASCDRGIKKYKLDTGGYAIVYEPQPSTRKYVKQYVVSEQDGKKQLKCKINKEIFYLDFEVFLFDSLYRVFDVLHVCDLIETPEYTKEIEIPSQTAYVSIFLNRVDNKVINKKPRVKLSLKSVIGFWICSTLLTVAFAFAVKYGMANIFGGVFRQSLMLSLKGNILTALVAVVADAVCMLVLTFVLKKKKK